MASGPSLDSEIVNRWSSYLTQGFNKDTRELWANIPFPGNCPLLEAPKLNPEIEAILSSTDSKKDSFLANIQSKFGKGLTYMGYALDELIKSSSEKEEYKEVIRKMVDSSQMLCEGHYLLSVHRRHQLFSFIKDPSALKIATDSKSDEWIFGKDFGEKSKTAQTVLKSATEVLLTKPSSSMRPSTSYGNLNSKRQLPRTRMKFSQPEKFNRRNTTQQRKRSTREDYKQNRYQKFRRYTRN